MNVRSADSLCKPSEQSAGRNFKDILVEFVTDYNFSRGTKLIEFSGDWSLKYFTKAESNQLNRIKINEF